MNAARPSRPALLPFRVGLDPMDKLLVADFKGDPEFKAIEPQIFNDPVGGRGMRVLRYRKDGKVDVYWQPGVRVDKRTFTVGAGLADFAETAIEPARFEITERGLDLHLAFTDSQGRPIELRVREDAPGKKGFALLAPVGADIANPLQLFLVYMPRFDFVRRAGTRIEGRIGDRPLRPASMPLLLRGRRILLMRYAEAPVIGTLNPPATRPVAFDLQASGSVEAEGMSIAADAQGRIVSLGTGRAPNLVRVDFRPGFPNLLDLADGDSSSGRWSIEIAGARLTGGSYGAARRGGRLDIDLDVLERWKPARLPLSMDAFTRLVRVFRTWPPTYRWRGAVDLGAAPTLSGKWERVHRG